MGAFLLEAPPFYRSRSSRKARRTGSHSPPGDLQARLQGEGGANLHRRGNSGFTVREKPTRWVGFSVGGATLLSIVLVAQSAANRFAFAARRSASSLARRRASESSPKGKFRDLILKTAILSPVSNGSFTRSSVCWLTERTFYGILSRKDRDIVTGRKS